MIQGDLLLITGDEVVSLLTGREQEIIKMVRRAYECHAVEDDSLPHSTFLRFPHDSQSRIIALPAYLGGDFNIVGIKWISSFPSNHDIGLDRASAVTILNSSATGRAEAILDGSVISAKRTASSAALAAQTLRNDRKVTRAGMIGCGLINFEITRFLLSVFPELRSFVLFDQNEESAKRFQNKCLTDFEGLEIEIAASGDALFGGCQLISFATTAVAPHVYDLSKCAPGTTVLHISLRDLSPELILTSDNVVDDADHVCRAQTSIHLAEQMVGNRDFIRCSLGEILRGAAPSVINEARITIFSPFGLGTLDLAVSKLVLDLAVNNGVGRIIDTFFPKPWLQWPHP
jgi:N-[(2S)-2-amino-2-carboxyethyl]-L-glutamate dehydrogenase